MLAHLSSIWDQLLRRISISKHRIELLPNSNPVHSAPYRAGAAVWKLKRLEIENTISQKVIKPAQTKWAIPIVFASKIDGLICFCVDFRNLKNSPWRDSYPIPMREKGTTSLGEATVISTLDANKGYCQTKIEKTDRKKTFTSHNGQNRSVRQLFGFNIAPGRLQRAMNVIFVSV